MLYQLGLRLRAEEDAQPAAVADEFLQGLDGRVVQPRHVAEEDRVVFRERVVVQETGRLDLRIEPRLDAARCQGCRQKPAAGGLGIAIDDEHGHRQRQIDDQEPMIVGCHRVAGQVRRHGMLARRAEQHRKRQVLALPRADLVKNQSRASRGVFFQRQGNFAGLLLAEVLDRDFHVQRHAGGPGAGRAARAR